VDAVAGKALEALAALREDSGNSNKLRHAGSIAHLVVLAEDQDQDLQMAVAVAIWNIRTNCVWTESTEK
jgi:hypothetical protein